MSVVAVTMLMGPFERTKATVYAVGSNPRCSDRNILDLVDADELANGMLNVDVNAITWIMSRLRDIREWPSTIGG